MPDNPNEPKTDTEEGELSTEEVKQIIDKEFEGIAENDLKRHQAAMNRALILIGLENERRSSHQHIWEYVQGRDKCTICGEDGGSPWDC